VAFGFSIDAKARQRLPLIALAALAMGALLWLARFVLAWTANAHGLVQAAVLGILIAGGLVIYGMLLVLFGVITKAGLRRH
jgi:putative peptidoglycan lipid II flippase